MQCQQRCSLLRCWERWRAALTLKLRLELCSLLVLGLRRSVCLGNWASSTSLQREARLSLLRAVLRAWLEALQRLRECRLAGEDKYKARCVSVSRRILKTWLKNAQRQSMSSSPGLRHKEAQLTARAYLALEKALVGWARVMRSQKLDEQLRCEVLRSSARLRGLARWRGMAVEIDIRRCLAQRIVFARKSQLQKEWQVWRARIAAGRRFAVAKKKAGLLQEKLFKVLEALVLGKWRAATRAALCCWEASATCQSLVRRRVLLRSVSTWWQCHKASLFRKCWLSQVVLRAWRDFAREVCSQRALVERAEAHR